MALIQQQCLYCKSTSNEFTSPEHIVPESLGNKELILPVGVVCDRCNHGKLALLDDFLLNFEAISFVRVINRIPNKEGRMPSAKFGNMIFKTTATGIGVEMDKMSSKHFIEGTPLNDNSVPLKFKMKGRKFTRGHCALLARALYKIALGITYLDEGPLLITDKRFDEVRDIILEKKKDFSGYIILESSAPTSRSNMSYRIVNLPDGTRLYMYQFDFFGIKFMFDFEKRELVNGQILRDQGFSVLQW